MFTYEVYIGNNTQDTFDTSISKSNFEDICRVFKTKYNYTQVKQKYYYTQGNIFYNTQGELFIKEYISEEIKTISKRSVFIAKVNITKLDPIEFNNSLNYILEHDIYMYDFSVNNNIKIKCCQNDSTSYYIKLEIKTDINTSIKLVNEIIDIIYKFHK